MRQLQRKFEVETRYGGGFVQEIDGVSGGRRSGRPVDWFYYVNGIEAESGAAARRLEPGDRVWWDHHDWGGAMRIPAVVGSFPEPFKSGAQGKSIPVRIDCAEDSRRECREVRKRLEEAGAKVGGSGTLGTRAGPGRAAAARRPLVGGPRRPDGAADREGAEGVGRVRAAGRGGAHFELLDPRGEPRALARRGRGAGRGDALPGPAADVGGDGHRPGGRGRGGGRAGRDAAEGSLRGRAGERARGAGAAADDCRRGTGAGRRRDLPPPRRARCTPRARASARCSASCSRAWRCRSSTRCCSARCCWRCSPRPRRREVGDVVARSLLWGLPFALLIAAINALVVRDGLTVIARLGRAAAARGGRRDARGDRVRRRSSGCAR